MNYSKNSQCQATTKTGMCCRAAATATGFCFFHSNPNRAAELGRIGGLAKRKVPMTGLATLHATSCAQEVGNVLDGLAQQVYERKLPPSAAQAIVSILRLKLLALTNSNTDERISKLEDQFQRLQLTMTLADTDVPGTEHEDFQAEE
jgi:hypothetical protein